MGQEEARDGVVDSSIRGLDNQQGQLQAMALTEN